MKITSTSYINGKLSETTVNEIIDLKPLLDDTPNFINFPKKVINAKHYREKRYNKYEHFTKFIHAMYPNAKNILDVGSGNSESSILLKELGYNVTSMDIFNFFQTKVLDYYKINYVMNYFDLKTDISSYDLVTGLHCCDGIEKIIRNCLKQDKEFVVTICETNQGMFQPSPNKNRKEYINYLKNISSALKITMLPIYYDKFDNDYFGETIYYKKNKN